MPTVALPDGRVVSFPDSMSHDQIVAAIQSLPATAAVNPAPIQTLSSAPSQASGLGRYPAMAGSEALKGLDIGLGIPGDLESTGIRYIGNPLARLTGIGSEEDPNQTIFPRSQDLLNFTGRLGLTDRPDLIPGWGDNPKTEKLLSAGAQGLGSVVPQAVISPASRLPVALSGLAGGEAGEAAHEIFPNNPLAPLVAGATAGGLVQAGRSYLGAGSVQKIANSLGSSETLEQAGTALQSAARDWRNTVMPQREVAAWAPVDAAVPGDSPVMMANFGAALQSINSKGGSLQPIIDATGNSTLKRMQDALDNKTPVGLGSGSTWSDARALRTWIGDKLSDPTMIRDIGQQNLSQLYSAITKDLRATAGHQGAADLFDTANATSASLHDFAEGPLSRVVASGKASSDDPKPESVASALLTQAKKGSGDIAALRSELPSAVDELAAAHLNMNPEKWNRLSPEGKAALVPDASQRASLDTYTDSKLSKQSAGTTALKSLAGLGVGGPAATGIGYLLGHADPSTELGLEAAGHVAGFVAPHAFSLAKDIYHNPSILQLPAAGATGSAGNALWPWPMPTRTGAER